jgi:hypothetical protein
MFSSLFLGTTLRLLNVSWVMLIHIQLRLIGCESAPPPNYQRPPSAAGQF